MNNASLAAIIVAGGKGERMGADCPKQFLTLGDCEIIQHTLNRFVGTELFSELIVVCHKDYIGHVSELLKFYEPTLRCVVVCGGSTRQESVKNGLDCVESAKYVMIHDAVRCCINPDDIKKLSRVLEQCDACALGVKVNDTIKLSDDCGNIVSTVDRTNLWHIQTPQAFKTDVIITAHNEALLNGFAATDDCAVAEYAGVSVKIVEGSYTNIKITTPSDILMAEQYMKGGC